MTDLETRVLAIVRKVAEAESLGGGFRLYHETAVTELVALLKCEACRVRGLSSCDECDGAYNPTCA